MATIKDLEVRIQILENSTKTNEDRIAKLENKQGEMIEQQIAVKVIENQLEALNKTQKDMIAKMEEIRVKIENIQLNSDDIEEIKKEVSNNTDFKNKNKTILNIFYWIVGVIFVALTGAIINNFLG
jgi:uncharacterized protein involved in exopolysaccharide biosynthesis